jgi:hypothetical protein
LDRRIELRDMRVKKRLENVKRLKAVEEKEVSLTTIRRKMYEGERVGFLGDESMMILRLVGSGLMMMRGSIVVCVEQEGCSKVGILA